jgi:hypothetical protein
VRSAQRVTWFEARAARVATAFAGRSVSVECADAASWRALAAEHGFDRATTWALTPLHWDSARGRPAAGSRAILSPRACQLASSFASEPTEQGSRLCWHGGGPRPVLGECDGWAAKLTAVHVLSHESMHLAGVVDEASAECFAVQLDAVVAIRLGASERFAHAMAREYWTLYHPEQDRAYQSRECREGGALDLFPDHSGWPSPRRYPGDISRLLRSFAADAPST